MSIPFFFLPNAALLFLILQSDGFTLSLATLSNNDDIPSVIPQVGYEEGNKSVCKPYPYLAEIKRLFPIDLRLKKGSCNIKQMIRGFYYISTYRAHSKKSMKVSN